MISETETALRRIVPPKEKAWINVEPLHCHQRLPENALISHVRVVSDDLVHTELRCKFVPEKLTFFFDHEIDHLPGMLEVSALRQASLVLAHLVYGVQMDFVAMLDWMNIRLFNYGELHEPTLIKSVLSSKSVSKERVELVLDGLMVQGSYPIMSAKGKLAMFSPRFAQRIRHKKSPSIHLRFGQKVI